MVQEYPVISGRGYWPSSPWQRHDNASCHIGAAIQQSKASVAELSARYALNPKTVSKWRKRDFVADAPMGPEQVWSSVLISAEEEAMVIAFRKHTLLPLDNYLYALQANIPRGPFAWRPG